MRAWRAASSEVEGVAMAPDRAEQPIGPRGRQLSSQARYRRAHQLRSRLGVVAPDLLAQALEAHHLTGVRNEVLE